MEDRFENPYLELVLDKKIPDHSLELILASDLLEKIQIEFKNIISCECIILSDEKHEFLYESTIKILHYVGKLSIHIFNLESEIAEQYTRVYIQSPQLGKKLWYDHYQSLHKPYSILKNRCFRLLDKIDEAYIKINKKIPPNYNSHNLIADQEDHHQNLSYRYHQD